MKSQRIVKRDVTSCTACSSAARQLWPLYTFYLVTPRLDSVVTVCAVYICTRIPLGLFSPFKLKPRLELGSSVRVKFTQLYVSVAKMALKLVPTEMRIS
jgi:hypothetical protein